MVNNAGKLILEAMFFVVDQGLCWQCLIWFNMAWRFVSGADVVEEMYLYLIYLPVSRVERATSKHSKQASKHHSTKHVSTSNQASKQKQINISFISVYYGFHFNLLFTFAFSLICSSQIYFFASLLFALPYSDKIDF